MGWNLRDLRKKLKHYKRLRKNETNADKQLKLDETIGSIEEILDYFTLSFLNIRPSLRNIFDTDTKFIETYHELNPYVLNFVDRFETEELSYEVDLTQNPDITPKRILTITDDFYNEIRDTRFVKHSRYLNLRRNELVNFKKGKQKFGNSDDAGTTFQIYNTKDILMHINTNNTLEDYATTIHEYAHAIAFLINQDHSTDYGKFPFVEVDSIFFEMLGTEYVGLVENSPTQALNIDIDRFYDYLLSALIISCKLNIHSMIVDDKLNKRDIVKYLKEVEKLENGEIKNVLYKPMADYYHFVISYLTAIELYIIYQDYPEEALDALHDIISIKDVPSTEYIKLLKEKYGIELGQNTHVYFEMLRNRIGVLTDGKQIQYKS